MKLHSGNKYLVVGVMSGTSLDGLDLAAVSFFWEEGRWRYSFVEAETVTYPVEWTTKLRNAPALSGAELMELHNAYGRLIGREINQFVQKYRLLPALIASHGHTIFHQPAKRYTFQLGNGACIAAETGITTIADFRSGDVALGGQGAPLVPVGDKLLFPQYNYCLNLGGFANVSFEKDGKRVAFDICPVNYILNRLAETTGKPFDNDGEMGRIGRVDKSLYEKLNLLDFYREAPPKSLGREWMEEHFFPVADAFEIPVNDKLRTVYEHIATQHAHLLPKKGKMLVTGGGALNSFLIEKLTQNLSCEIVIPHEQLIHFKEALVFAFIGLLRYLEEINCYASVTGAAKDSCSGVVYITR